MARYDKYDPVHGGFRAPVAVAFPDADLGAAWGAGINSAGQFVKGAGQTGVVGLIVVTQKPGRVGPTNEVRVVDIMLAGCVTDFGPSTPGNVPGINFGIAGANYYSDNYGQISSNPFGPQVQNLVIVGTPTGGTYTLTYAGQTTTALAYDATASEIQTALQALSTIGSGNVTVTGSGTSSAPFVVTFVNDLAPQTPQIASPALITATSSLTGGTSPSVAVSNASPSTYVGFTVEPDRLQCSVSPNAAIVTSPPVPAVDVPQVAGLTATTGSITDDSIPLTWDAVSGASQYIVLQSNDGGINFTPIAIEGGGYPTTNSATAIFLGASQEYEFEVAAVVDGVVGPYSSTVTATTSAATD